MRGLFLEWLLISDYDNCGGFWVWDRTLFDNVKSGSWKSIGMEEKETTKRNKAGDRFEGRESMNPIWKVLEARLTTIFLLFKVPNWFI